MALHGTLRVLLNFSLNKFVYLPTRVNLASEFRYMSFFPEKNSAYIFISQSGETADTLEALRLVNGIDLPTIALTNVPSSTMVREADGFLLTQAGQEIAVASTKAFSTQIAALYWLAHRLHLKSALLMLNKWKQQKKIFWWLRKCLKIV